MEFEFVKIVNYRGGEERGGSTNVPLECRVFTDVAAGIQITLNYFEAAVRRDFGFPAHLLINIEKVKFVSSGRRMKNALVVKESLDGQVLKFSCDEKTALNLLKDFRPKEKGNVYEIADDISRIFESSGYEEIGEVNSDLFSRRFSNSPKLER